MKIQMSILGLLLTGAVCAGEVEIENTKRTPESIDEQVELLCYNIAIKYPVRVVSEDLSKLTHLTEDQAQRIANALCARVKKDSNMSISLQELRARFPRVTIDISKSTDHASRASVYSWWCCPRRS
jgi:hypothetical protein